MTSRRSLGSINPHDAAVTVLRVVGKDGKTPVLDVAAFQSFADDGRPAVRPVTTSKANFNEE